ncbi:MAG: hypothetical protein DHS20C15_25780 [Planctomycetota bacterium]|nr:MAG: hypothetical protein DHS20C15_25780 [Planctomycetota bacterium]
MNLRILFVILFALAAAVGVTAYTGDTETAALAPLPVDPAAGEVELLLARPFQLDTPAVHVWRAEQPEYRSGWVLVMKVDPAMVAPRQTYEPVLFAGTQTVERINRAQLSGHLVGILPAAPDAELADFPLFFGEPALPEQVDATRATQALATARDAGLSVASKSWVAERTESPVRFRDVSDLQLFAADLIAEWAPDEQELVDGLRAPRVR